MLDVSLHYDLDVSLLLRIKKPIARALSLATAKYCDAAGQCLRVECCEGFEVLEIISVDGGTRFEPVFHGLHDEVLKQAAP